MVSVITILLILGLIMVGIATILVIGGPEHRLFEAILIVMMIAGICHCVTTSPQPDQTKTQTLPQVLQTLHNTTKMCVKENLNLIKTKQDINLYNFNNCKIAISDNILSCTCKMKASIPNNIIHAQSTCSNQNNTIKCDTEYQKIHKDHESSPGTLTNVITIISEISVIIALGFTILYLIL